VVGVELFLDVDEDGATSFVTGEFVGRAQSLYLVNDFMHVDGRRSIAVSQESDGHVEFSIIIVLATGLEGGEIGGWW
jgi:hypothetical protein